MRSNHSLIVLAAAAAFGVSGSALAQTGTTGGALDVDLGTSVTITSVDKDANGTVSKTEAASNQELTKQFGTLDTNKDGNLDQAEFARFEASGSMSGDVSTEPSTTSPSTTTTPPPSK